MSDLHEPDPDLGVYLDTNVLIDFAEGMNPVWAPPARPTKSERQWIAAVRLFFFGYRSRNGWYLVISGEGRAELTARGAPDWTLPVFFDIDEQGDAPTQSEIQVRADDFVWEANLDAADARHLARAAMHDWIRLFVTNDRDFIRRANRLHLPTHLRLVTAIEAEELLEITPGEQPPISPAKGVIDGRHPTVVDSGVEIRSRLRRSRTRTCHSARVVSTRVSGLRDVMGARSGESLSATFKDGTVNFLRPAPATLRCLRPPTPPPPSRRAGA